MVRERNKKYKYKTTGLDLSRAMLQQARINNPKGEFVQGNMTNPDLSKDELWRGREKLKNIHRLLIEKGFKEKAKLLVNWITEEVLDESRKHKPNLERERPGRAVSRALQGSNRTK